MSMLVGYVDGSGNDHIIEGDVSQALAILSKLDSEDKHVLR